MKTLIAIMVGLILFAASVTAIVPPPGIPDPKDYWGGIQDPTEDISPERPWPWLTDIPGYYCVAPGAVGATDVERTYGNPIAPRKTIPGALPRGSYVELHGMIEAEEVHCAGTPEKWVANTSGPVWILSDPAEGQATLTGRLTVSGTYAYICWLMMDQNDPNTGEILVGPGSDHISVQNCSLRKTDISALIGVGVTVDPAATYIVSWNNCLRDPARDLPLNSGEVRMDGWGGSIYGWNVNPDVASLPEVPPVIDPDIPNDYPPPIPLLLRMEFL